MTVGIYKSDTVLCVVALSERCNYAPHGPTLSADNLCAKEVM